MRNQRVVLVAAILVLLLGGGLAVYLVAKDSSTGTTTPIGQTNAGRDGGAEADSTPADTGSSATASAQSGTTLTSQGPDSADGADAGSQPVLPGTAGETVARPVAAGETESVGTTDDPRDQWPLLVDNYVITGVVTYKADGRPAVGASVSAEHSDQEEFDPSDIPDVSSFQREVHAAKVEGSATTDGAGEFTLRITYSRRELPQTGERASKSGGAVLVKALMAGYAPARSGPVSLSEKSERKVSLQLAIPVALSGRVIDGVSRAGISGAVVSLVALEEGTSAYMSPRTLVTDAEGYFSASDLPAASYMYSVTAAGYAGGATNFDYRTRVDLSKGGERNLGDIALLRNGGITGLVVDAAQGTPIFGAGVEAQQKTAWGNHSMATATTDAEGRFKLESVGVGQYSLRVSSTGLAPGLRDNVVVESGGVVDVGTIKLERGFTLRGKAVDSQGKPVARLSIQLREKSTQSMGFGGTDGERIARTRSAADGTFTLEGLFECESTIMAEATGFAPYRQDLVLRSGMSPIELRLSQGGSVSGRVLSAQGQPAPEASVQAIGHDDPRYSLFKMFDGQTPMGFDSGLECGPDGTFVIENLPAGSYLVYASTGKGQSAHRDNVKVTEGGQQNIGDLAMPGKGSLSVTVTEGGAPVTGLKVELGQGFAAFAGGGDGPSQTTDAAGVALFTDLDAGTFVIVTERDKGQVSSDVFQKRRVTVQTGQLTEFKLELQPDDTANLRGRLTINGRPLFREINLLGTGSQASFFKQSKPDENGNYELPAIERGEYVLVARIDDNHVGCLLSVSVTMVGNVEVSRDFAGHTVSGNIGTPANTPEERAAVQVILTRSDNVLPEIYGQWLKGTVRCDHEGNYRFENISPANYRITAMLAGVGNAQRDANVSGNMSSVDLALANNSGSLRVTLKKLHGSPVGGASFGAVQLRDGAGQIVALASEQEGFFVPSTGVQVDLSTVPAGTYTVVVSAGGFLTAEKAGIVIEATKRSTLDMELTAAAELHLTVTNTEITQAMLDAASVRCFDAQGVEVPRQTSAYDMFMPGTPPTKPTLKARNIGPTVTQVKIKLAGFAEISLAVEFEAGRKIEKNETLVAQ